MTPGDIAALVTAVVAVAALVGGYVQFVLRRAGLGFIEFDVELTLLHRGPTQLIAEIACVLKNVGSSMVLIENMQLRINYRMAGDDEGTWDGVEPSLEHFIEPDRPQDDPRKRKKIDDPEDRLREHRFWLLRPRTFIQPGVTQRYRLPAGMPAKAQVLHVWAAFDYRIETKGLTRFLIRLAAKPPPDLDWRQGVRLHTIRRTFSLAALVGAEQSEGTEPEQGAIRAGTGGPTSERLPAQHDETTESPSPTGSK